MSSLRCQSLRPKAPNPLFAAMGAAILFASNGMFAQTPPIPLEANIVVSEGPPPLLTADFLPPFGEGISAIEANAGGLSVGSVSHGPVLSESDGETAILVMVDVSIPMAKVFPKIRSLLAELASSEPARNGRLRLGLATFADTLTEVTQLGSPVTDFEKALASIQLDGRSTELYRSLLRAIEVFADSPQKHKSIIVFSDGKPEDTQFTRDEAVAAAKSAGVRIHGVGFPMNNAGIGHLQTLTRLAEETGGLELRADDRNQTLPADASKRLLHEIAGRLRVKVPLIGTTRPSKIEILVSTISGAKYAISHELAAAPPALPAAGSSAPAPAPPATPPMNDTPPPPTDPSTTPVQSPNDPGSATPADPAVTDAGLLPPPVTDPLPSTWHEHLLHWWKNNTLVGYGLIALLIAVVLAVVARSLRGNSGGGDLAPPPPPGGEFTDYVDLVPPSPAPIYGWLETMDGQQTKIPLSKKAIRIGSGEDNDLVLHNRKISQHHAEILVTRAGEVYVTDLKSLNGIRVDGSFVSDAALKGGEVIEFAEVRYRYLAPDNGIQNQDKR